MSDRELLERAAKACVLDGWYWNGDDMMYVKGHSYEKWRPLEDDGDAFRLAVKLNIFNTRSPGYEWPVAELFGLHGDDPYAATRRAIVRAAAALAKDAT